MEVDGLVNWNVWTVRSAQETTPGAIIMGGRFFLTMKNFLSPDERVKVWFIEQEFDDKEKPAIVHDTAIIRASSVLLMFSSAAQHEVSRFSHDVTQAYLQNKDNLIQNICIKVKNVDRHLIRLKENELLHLIKLLYGLCDSCEYCGLKIHDHVVEDLGMTPNIGNTALYTNESNVNVDGVCGSYVGTSLKAGSVTFEKLAKATLTMFECKACTYNNVHLYGAQIRTVKPGMYEVAQTYYVKNLSYVPKNTKYEVRTVPSI